MKKNTHGPRGPKGDVGQIGPIGATGPTGPTGPSGTQTVARSTQTLDAGEEARVSSTQEGDTTFLDFYIPKGLSGVADKIALGTTTTLDAGEDARVQDRFENGVHNFDFYIPKGENGAVGPAGPAGPAGLTPNFAATIYKPAAQQITSNTPIMLEETELMKGFKVQGNNSLVAPAKGIYMVSFFVNEIDAADDGDSVSLAVNGVVVTASKRPLSTIGYAIATIMTELNKDDVLTLVPTITQSRNINAFGGPSAELVAMMIAYS